MFTKIYERFKRFIKENYKELIVYIIVLVLVTYPLPYYIYIGGGIEDLNKRIDLKSNETGSYNMAYVKEMHATIPTYLLSFVIKTWDLESINALKFSEDEDDRNIDIREKLYLEEANNNAIINAYTKAEKDVEIIDNSYKVIYISEYSDTNIQIGDTLVSVNGVKINNNTEYKEYIKTLEVNSKVEVIVKRNEELVTCYAKLIEKDNEKIMGLYLVNVIDYKVDPPINLSFKWNESGPSAGFMLSLAIYDKLVSEDLTKGRMIVGTGTIDINGNVGAIGGVKYKLMGAVQSKADIFFVPGENYEEAMEVKKKFNYDIKVVKVDTLDDAINYLKNTKK
ncbi:MAG: PDZ domain-containing protein [Bacilli bacterium]|nr:PDZ domain-containing protein [Bacilli bacterium]